MYWEKALPTGMATTGSSPTFIQQGRALPPISLQHSTAVGSAAPQGKPLEMAPAAAAAWQLAAGPVLVGDVARTSTMPIGIPSLSIPPADVMKHNLVVQNQSSGGSLYAAHFTNQGYPGISDGHSAQAIYKLPSIRSHFDEPTHTSFALTGLPTQPPRIYDSAGEDYSSIPTNAAVGYNTLISPANPKRQTRSKDGKFECPICGKRFSQSGNLNRHKVVHTKERKYKCEVRHVFHLMKFPFLTLLTEVIHIHIVSTLYPGLWQRLLTKISCSHTSNRPHRNKSF